MIYYLLWHLRAGERFGFYAYQNVVFRSVAATLTSILIALLIGPKIIRWLMRKKIGDGYSGLVRRERDRILKMGAEDSQYAAYQTFPYAAQLAIADSVARQQLEFPEVPLMELIELYGGKIADAPENERPE